MSEPRQPVPPVSQITTSVYGDTSSLAYLLDQIELESLILNMHVSLRVRMRSQLFTWTQGLLQDLVKHELLICSSNNPGQATYLVDNFATSADETRLFSDLFRRDASLAPHLVKTWEENDFEPVVCDTGSMGSSNVLARELSRIGADKVLAHGTYDELGKLASLFVFACRSDAIGAKQIYFVKLIVPFLQLAWLRSRVNRAVENAGEITPKANRITAREREILRWIQLGKSNHEIGIILDISPLTVKNHVQKILRKLNVLNRAQAVGTALALRILNM
ncbi:MAG: hypothetical protein HY066_04850 [Betaproteobacteria bacterium]|nr:hypothetical protein [Betaproteobacteria bacterium]